MSKNVRLVYKVSMIYLYSNKSLVFYCMLADSD